MRVVTLSGSHHILLAVLAGTRSVVDATDAALRPIGLRLQDRPD